jgi:hypothetical protein
VLVRGAEDKRFELLRGCPQHAFQVCSALFVAVRPVPGSTGRLRHCPAESGLRRNETETETRTDAGLAQPRQYELSRGRTARRRLAVDWLAIGPPRRVMRQD